MCLKWNFLVIILSFLCNKMNIALAQFNMTAYRLMPPLYHFDDYDRCLEVKNNTNATSIYCVAYIEIMPNSSSKLWQQIEVFSSNPLHYRHDHLFYGVCLERCLQLMDALSQDEINQLFSGQTPKNNITDYYAKVHKRSTDDHEQYAMLINTCLNYDFKSTYNLTVNVYVEYCENSRVQLKKDTLDLSVSVIFICIVITTIFCTFYDLRLKRKQPLDNQNNNFYKNDLTSSVHLLLTSFSLCRNYYRLVLQRKTKDALNLKFFDALRTIVIAVAVFTHITMVFVFGQISNTEFIEQMNYDYGVQLLKNGTVVLHILFILSGFLLYISMVEKHMVLPTTSLTKCFCIYVKILILRYLRFMPTYLLMILFNATFLIRLQDGPFWRHVAEAERVFCRETWWKNVFLFNNFSNHESCSVHTWYIAADMQFFMVYVFLIILLMRYPALKKCIFVLITILAIVIPTIITYVYKLDAVYQLNPENYRYLFFKDLEIYDRTYLPFYTNLGGYLFGIIAADIYLKYKESPSKSYKGVFKYEFMWWLHLFCPVLITSACIAFTSYDFEKPSIWTALFAGLYKNIFTMVCAVVILGMCFKLGGIVFEFFNSSIFRPLASISYQAYLWHVIVLRVVLGYFRQPIYASILTVLTTFMSSLMLTNLIAFIMALLVEYPFAELTKLFLMKQKNKS